MKLDKKNYRYLSDIFSVLALLWICIGFYTYDFYEKIFKPPPVPAYGPFNIFHEGAVLLLSGLGTLAGIQNIIKNRSWAASFFINMQRKL